MSQYYYFSASLPMLEPDAPPPMSNEEFLESCERLLTTSDFQEIQRASLNMADPAETRIDLLERFQNAEHGLRNELVKLRAKKLGIEQDRYIREESQNPLLAAAAREILEQETPLKAEHYLNGVLWTILEDLSVGHYFDIDFLAAYFLKLQILQRRARFEVEAGEQKLESILSGDKKDG
jgi:hypothetical protein